MTVKDEPNKVTATLKVKVTAEFYDDESTAETLRYYVEQDLEDAGFDVEVTPLKEREHLMVEQPKPVDLEDEVKAWLDKMDAVDALANIADICIDWDGYRTADGLGGLINEIWAYAKYQANRLLKEQEPASPTGDRYAHFCGKCGAVLALYKQKYCFECGRRVKWDA